MNTITLDTVDVAKSALHNISDPAEVLGERIGSFILQEIIGRGGSSTVYKGIHETLGYKVAVKIYDFVLTDQSENRPNRAKIEASILSTIQHPEFVKLIDYGFDPIKQRAFLILEFIEGRLLSDSIVHVGRLSISNVANIGKQIAEAMSYAHDKGIIHLDLKPSSIFVNSQGIKIFDFSVSKFAQNNDITVTLPGSLVGTPRYISPEAFSRAETTTKSDVYSLGICLYQMLTGAYPYEPIESSININAIANQHLHEEPHPLAKYIEDVPEDLEQLLRSMLSKDPLNRPSMSSVARHLQEIYSRKAIQLTKSREQAPAIPIESRQPVHRLSPRQRPFPYAIIALGILAFIVANGGLISNWIMYSNGSLKYKIFLMIAFAVLLVFLLAWALYFVKIYLRQRQTVPSRASVRKLLNSMLYMDSDIEAFCVDFFPELRRRYFSDGMDRMAKISILIDCLEVQQILMALSEYDPRAFLRFNHLIMEDS